MRIIASECWKSAVAPDYTQSSSPSPCFNLRVVFWYLVISRRKWCRWWRTGTLPVIIASWRAITATLMFKVTSRAMKVLQLILQHLCQLMPLVLCTAVEQITCACLSQATSLTPTSRTSLSCWSKTPLSKSRSASACSDPSLGLALLSGDVVRTAKYSRVKREWMIVWAGKLRKQICRLISASVTTSSRSGKTSSTQDSPKTCVCGSSQATYSSVTERNLLRSFIRRRKRLSMKNSYTKLLDFTMSKAMNCAPLRCWWS